MPGVQGEHGSIGAFRILFLLGLLAATPFGAWRLERPKAEPIILSGQVYHQVLDKAPNFQHTARTYFEELFGNRPINIIDGPRIYVSQPDYERCWPEPWEDIYEQGYSILIKAEVKRLIFGGYSIANITMAERRDRLAPTSQWFTSPM